MRRWAARVDLVSPRDLRRFRERHIDDCLRLAPLVAAERPGPATDVGSGAGLPGIPLALADPRRPWRLLEPRRRRAAFLEEVVRELGLANCEVVALRAEEAAADRRFARAHALATARALAPPRRAFALVLPLVRPGGAALVMTSSGIPPEAEVAAPGVAIIRAGGVEA